jgi:hypothetical protein
MPGTTASQDAGRQDSVAANWGPPLSKKLGWLYINWLRNFCSESTDVLCWVNQEAVFWWSQFGSSEDDKA